MRQIHRLKDSIDDHRGPDSGAEAQKEHAAAVIASQRLHGSIIDNLNWTTEGPWRSQIRPARTKVVGFVERASVVHGAWIADRDEAIFPILGDALHISYHFARSHLGA